MNDQPPIDPSPAPEAAGDLDEIRYSLTRRGEALVAEHADYRFRPFDRTFLLCSYSRRLRH